MGKGTACPSVGRAFVVLASIPVLPTERRHTHHPSFYWTVHPPSLHNRNPDQHPRWLQGALKRRPVIFFKRQTHSTNLSLVLIFLLPPVNVTATWIVFKYIPSFASARPPLNTLATISHLLSILSNHSTILPLNFLAQPRQNATQKQDGTHSTSSASFLSPDPRGRR